MKFAGYRFIKKKRRLFYELDQAEAIVDGLLRL